MGRQTQPPPARSGAGAMPWLLALGLAAALAWALFRPDGGAPEPAKPDVEMAAGAFATDYAENHTVAKMKYDGKTVALTGPFNDVGEDIGQPFIEAYGFSQKAGGLAAVRCMLAKGQEPAVIAYKPGSTVTVVGRPGPFYDGVRGVAKPYVQLDGCVLKR